jgi:hypothetical protein
LFWTFAYRLGQFSSDVVRYPVFDYICAEYVDSLNVKLPQHTVSELRMGLAGGKFTHFIKLDVTNFYPSVDHDILEAVLKRKIRKKEIHHLIRAAIETPTVAYAGMPPKPPRLDLK